MENNENRREDRFWMIFGIVVGAIGVGTGLYCRRQMKKTLRMVNKAARSVEDLAVVDIRDGIVERAVEMAAARQTSRAVEKAVHEVERDISAKTGKLVKEAVERSYGKIKGSVAETIAKKAADIDISDIIEDATDKAKDLLLARFDGKLDALVSDYQRNLDNVGKIYQSIAASMTDKSGKDVTFKIG